MKLFTTFTGPPEIFGKFNGVPIELEWVRDGEDTWDSGDLAPR